MKWRRALILAFLSTAASLAAQDALLGIGLAYQMLHDTVLSAIERSGAPALESDIRDAALSWAATGSELKDTASAECLRVRWSLEAGRKRLRLFFREPLQVEGIAKSLSFWVDGPLRGRLSCALVVRDIRGIDYELPAFDGAPPGFRRVTLSVPPFIAQTDSYLPGKSGAAVVGFIFAAEGSAEIAFGLDRLEATVDTFFEDSADEDAMEDWW